MGTKKKVTDQESENGISKEFQLFVVSHPSVRFMGMRTMGQRLIEQSEILEVVIQSRLQFVQGSHKYKRLREGLFPAAAPIVLRCYLPIFAPAALMKSSYWSIGFFKFWYIVFRTSFACGALGPFR